MAQVTELVTKFSFVGQLDPLSKFHKDLSLASKVAFGFVATLGAVGIAYAKFAGDTLLAIAPLDTLSRQTKIAVGRIQELGYTAGQTGSTNEAMNSTLSGLSKTIGDAALRGNETFGRLGISVRGANGQIRNADDVLMQVGRRFRQLGLSMQMQESFAGALGIDASLLQMLNKTEAEMAGLAKRARELGTLNNAQAEAAAKYKSAVNALDYGLNSLKQQIAIGVAPAMEKMVSRMIDWIAANKEWIKSGAEKLAEALDKFAQSAERLGPLLLPGGALIVGFKLLTAGTKAWGTALKTAGILAFILAVDDLVAALKGHDSLIGDFFKDFFNIDLSVQFDKMMTDIKAFLAEVKALGVGHWLINDTPETAARQKDQQRDRGELAKQEREKETGMTEQQLRDEEFFKFLSRVFAKFTGPTTPPAAPSTTINQTNNIDIKTSADPKAVADAVVSPLQKQLKDAEAQANRGGR